MYKCENMEEFYKVAGKDLLNTGEVVYPRGSETKEMLNANFMIANPRGRLVYYAPRKFSLIYAIVESLMLVQNTKQLAYFSEFNNNIHNFSDDGDKLYGAYGARIVQSINSAIEKLKSDRDSRQAVCPILEWKDICYKTKDQPCTMAIHFMIRNNKLNMHTYMRSNDIMWGTQYDVFMFTMLQEVVANTLGIDVGCYYHNASSLHVYKDYYDLLAGMSENCAGYAFDNPYDLDEWIATGRWYIDKVDGKDERKVGAIWGNRFVQILTNEFLYKSNADKERYYYTKLFEWTVPFTQRWWQNG